MNKKMGMEGDERYILTSTVKKGSLKVRKIIFTTNFHVQSSENPLEISSHHKPDMFYWVRDSKYLTGVIWIKILRTTVDNPNSGI